MSNTLDLHFPDVCFEDVANTSYFITIFHQDHPIYSEISVTNLVGVFTWDLDSYFDVIKDFKKYVKNREYIGFEERYYYDVFYVKECLLSNVPEVEWNSNIFINDIEEFKELYNVETDSPVKVVCLRRVNPDLKKFNYEYKLNKF